MRRTIKQLNAISVATQLVVPAVRVLGQAIQRVVRHVREDRQRIVKVVNTDAMLYHLTHHTGAEFRSMRLTTVNGIEVRVPMDAAFTDVPGTGGVSVRVSETTYTVTHGKHSYPQTGIAIHLRHRRSVEAVQRLIDAALVSYKAALRRKGSGCIYVIGEFDGERNYTTAKLSPATFDDLFGPSVAAIRDRVLAFERDAPSERQNTKKHELKMILHGPPGCGKTSMAVAIARETRRRLVLVPLHTVKSLRALDDLLRYIEDEICSLQEAVILLEELDTWAPATQRRRRRPSASDAASSSSSSSSDSTFDEASSSSRRRSRRRSPSSASAQAARDNDYAILLTMLDGPVYHPGLLLIATTNHIDAFDERLTRPGRLTPIEVGPLEREHVGTYFRRQFGVDLPRDAAVPAGGVTLAQLSHILSAGSMGTALAALAAA